MADDDRVSLEPFPAVTPLSQQLESPEELKLRLRDILLQIGTRPTGFRPTLEFEEISPLLDKVANELQLKADILHELAPIFWMFDFDGNGMLKEPEILDMVLYILRHYRDSMSFPEPRVMFGKEIEFAHAHHKFNIEGKLCEGMQGAVYKGTGRCSLFRGSAVLKMYDKSSPNSPVEDITREFQILKSLRHPNFASIADLFQDNANFYVAQEHYQSDLTGLIHAALKVERVCVNEYWLAKIAYQIISGVAYLHENHLVHGNIKDTNVMSSRSQDLFEPSVVIMDCSVSSLFTNKQRPGGTPGFMPPEVWEYGMWTPKGDLFSTGVLLFYMRTGRHPFTEDCYSVEDVQKKTREDEPNMECGSRQLVQLVSSLLEKVFKWRPALVDVLANPWLNGSAEADEIKCVEISEGFAREMFASKVRDEEKAWLASNMSLCGLKDLNASLVKLDTDCDGVLTEHEVREALSNTLGQDVVDHSIGAFEEGSKEGVFGYEDVMGELIAGATAEENEIIDRLFSDTDRSGSGFLPCDDLEMMMQQPAFKKIRNGRDVAFILKEMIPNREGKVSFQDFRRAMLGYKEAGPGTSNGGAARPRRCAWAIGTQLEHRTAFGRDWVSCSVCAIDQPTGAVQVDCRPGYWFRGAELRAQLRMRGADSWLGWLSPRKRWTTPGSCSLCVNRL